MGDSHLLLLSLLGTHFSPGATRPWHCKQSPRYRAGLAWLYFLSQGLPTWLPRAQRSLGRWVGASAWGHEREGGPYSSIAQGSLALWLHHLLRILEGNMYLG